MRQGAAGKVGMETQIETVTSRWRSGMMKSATHVPAHNRLHNGSANAVDTRVDVRGFTAVILLNDFLLTCAHVSCSIQRRSKTYSIRCRRVLFIPITMDSTDTTNAYEFLSFYFYHLYQIPSIIEVFEFRTT